MPKKKFDPNAPHTKAAFNPSGEYGTEQAQSQQTAPPESQGMKVSDLLTGPAYMVRHPIDSARLLGGYLGGGEPETVNKTAREGEVGNRFAAPGATNTPLAQGISEAGAVASLMATPEIGAPRNLPVREGLRGAASKLKERISRTVTEQLRSAPTKTVKQEPVVNIGGGRTAPAKDIGRFMNEGYQSTGELSAEQAAARNEQYNAHAQELMDRQTAQDKLDAAANKASNARARLERQAQEQKGSVMSKDIEQARELEKSQVEAAAQNKKIDDKWWSDVQQERQQRAGAHAQMEQDIGEGQQARAAGRNEMYESLASARNRRGNPRATAATGATPEETPILKGKSAPTPPSEGRPATWTNERVVELATKSKDPLVRQQAIDQLNIRKIKVPNLKYITGEGSPFERNVSSNAVRNRFMSPDPNMLDAGMGTLQPGAQPPKPLSLSEQWSQVAANAAKEGADPQMVNRLNQISETMARAEKHIKNAPAERTGLNASGESAASQEAINRVASEKVGGIKRFRIDTRSGNEIPLTGVDAVDARPGQYDVIVERSPKGETVLDSGPKSRPYRSKR